jgi:hypothetical protein
MAPFKASVLAVEILLFIDNRDGTLYHLSTACSCGNRGATIHFNVEGVSVLLFQGSVDDVPDR